MGFFSAENSREGGCFFPGKMDTKSDVSGIAKYPQLGSDPLWQALIM